MFAYVVLHYQNYEITVECVEHVLQISNDSHIVIVDNCSPNGSGVQLQKKYGAESRVDVILNTENVGFARGNNTGFAFVRQNLKPEAIVVMNNDVMIEQKDFEQSIKEYLTDTEVDVCGPDILTPAGSHQNPLRSFIPTSFALRKQIMIDDVRRWCLKHNLFKERIMSVFAPKNIGAKTGLALNTNTGSDIILHGACIIYAKKYIENEQYAFLPVTFLYFEEFILADYLKHKGYKTGVCETAKVLHIGAQSTGSSNEDVKKLIYRIGQYNLSRKALLRARRNY